MPLSLVCAMRLYHRQLIGLRPGGSGYVNSYGADFVKKLEYHLLDRFEVGEKRGGVAGCP